MLEIPWGNCTEVVSIYEDWELQWDPAFKIILIEKSVWGNTVLEAATAFALHVAQQSQILPELSRLVQQILLAELSEAVPAVMKQLEDRAATIGDISQLMATLPGLVNTLAYGDVRRTPAEAVQRIVEGITVRIIIGLPVECANLDDDAAAKMFEAVIACDAAVRLLNDSAVLKDWNSVLTQMIDQDRIHGL